MFYPHNFPLALAMMILSAALWGSWPNTYKWAKGYAFDLFYWDFALGLFISAVLCAFVLGKGANGAGFAAYFDRADWSNIFYAVMGGVVFNLANILLLAAMVVVGMAVSIPLSIGIALVVGVVFSYAYQPRGSVPMLAAGVVAALAAVLFTGKAFGHLGPRKEVSRKGLVLCVVSGVLMGLWAPFSTRAMLHGQALDPYSVTILLTVGALGSCFVFSVYFMRHPIVPGPAGEPARPVAFREFWEAPVHGHLLGIAGGAMWTVATLFNLLAGTLTGEAISYAIGQSSPMISALWGVFVWREFRGASPKAKWYLVLMFAAYVVAIILVARATG